MDLISRARLRCEVFTNLLPDDMDLDKTSARANRSGTGKDGAVWVLSNASIRLGYVPAYYSWAVAELLRSRNDVHVSVMQFDPASDPDNPLRVSLSSVVEHTPDALLMASVV